MERDRLDGFNRGVVGYYLGPAPVWQQFVFGRGRPDCFCRSALEGACFFKGPFLRRNVDLLCLGTHPRALALPPPRNKILVAPLATVFRNLVIFVGGMPPIFFGGNFI